ncbi:MAG: L-idonate 5-dehydrogenase [Paracoccaceae bacterium]
MKAVVIHGARDLRIETVPEEALLPGTVRVKIASGGICGSDLHYYQDGGFGAIRVREPMILGHEISGHVCELGDGVDGLDVGDLVAISPSRPCGDCRFCDEGNFKHCLNMRFYGSAMPMPHIQGAFRENIVADAGNCYKLDVGISPAIAAFAEPLAVVLHGLNRGGDLAGKRVLVTGCGPIGALCVLALKAAGVAEVVVTDVIDPVLEIARVLGVDRAINVVSEPDWTKEYSGDKGTFDVMFECSGNEAALRDGLEVLRPLATLVQLGLGGDVSIPQNTIVAKEINFRGSFRFHEEFGDAVAMINAGVLNLQPLLTAQFAVEDAVAAFELAGDRTKAMKVQLDFTL